MCYLLQRLTVQWLLVKCVAAAGGFELFYFTTVHLIFLRSAFPCVENPNRMPRLCFALHLAREIGRMIKARLCHSG